MSPALLNVLLWLPFCIALIAAGVPFCLKGYKRGLWRSLVSLGVTAVSAILSICLGSLLAIPLSGPLSGLVFDLLDKPFAFGGILQPFAQTASKSIARVLLSLVFFFLFFLAITTVAKRLTDRIKSKPLDKKAQTTGMKWGGLGVRVLDTVLFALFLTLPLYGTLASYMPAAEEIIALSHEELPAERGLFLPDSYTDRMLELLVGTEKESTEKTVSRIADHPLSKLYSVPPLSTAYNGMSYVSYGDGVLNLTQGVRAATEFTERYRALLSSPADQYQESLAQFSAYLQEDVIDKDWFYVFCIQSLNQVCNGLEESIPQLSQAADQATFSAQLAQLRSLTGISKKHFRENSRILSLIAELSVQTNTKTDSYRKQVAELGELLSATQEAIDLKNAVFMTFVNFNDEIPSPLRQKILDSYIAIPYTDKNMQRMDAESFLLLLKNLRHTTADQITDILRKVPGYDETNVPLLNDPERNML